jgi:hypothetical protein
MAHRSDSFSVSDFLVGESRGPEEMVDKKLNTSLLCDRRKVNQQIVELTAKPERSN